jgi:hypothetical protein
MTEKKRDAVKKRDDQEGRGVTEGDANRRGDAYDTRGKTGMTEEGVGRNTG